MNFLLVPIIIILFVCLVNCWGFYCIECSRQKKMLLLFLNLCFLLNCFLNTHFKNTCACAHINNFSSSDSLRSFIYKYWRVNSLDIFRKILNVIIHIYIFFVHLFASFTNIPIVWNKKSKSKSFFRMIVES